MAPELAIALFLLAGLPSALVFYELPLAMAMGVAISLVGAYVALIAHLTADVPIGFVWGTAMTAMTAMLVAPWARHRFLVNLRRGWSPASIGLMSVFALLAILLAGFPEAADWDARNIWFFHAGWLLQPADVYLRAQTDPAVLISHPDYPALGPAAIAIVWQLVGTTTTAGEQSVATRVIAMLNLSLLLVAVGWLLLLGAGQRARHMGWIAPVALIALSAVHPGQGRNNGYHDVLQAASLLATGTVLVLVALRDGSRSEHIALGTLAALSANVKQEGLPFLACIVIATLLVIRSRRALRASLVAGAAAAVAWGIFTFAVTTFGHAPATDTAGIGGRILEFLDPGSVAWSVLTRMAVPYLVPYAAAFVGLALVARLAVSDPRTDEVARRAVSVFLVAILLTLGVIVATYCLGASRTNLDGWLVSSFIRVSSTLVGLSLGSVTLALLARTSPVPADASGRTSVLSSNGGAGSILNDPEPHQETHAAS